MFYQSGDGSLIVTKWHTVRGGFPPPLGTQNIGYTYGDISLGQIPDQIYKVSWNGQEKINYTYDGLGRLTNKSVISIREPSPDWTSVTVPDDPYVSRVDFGYNMDGQRISRTFTAPVLKNKPFFLYMIWFFAKNLMFQCLHEKKCTSRFC